jgi:hypothetical protein
VDLHHQPPPVRRRARDAVVPAVLLLRRYLTAAARRLTFMITVTFPQMERGKVTVIMASQGTIWQGGTLS